MPKRRKPIQGYEKPDILFRHRPGRIDVVLSTGEEVGSVEWRRSSDLWSCDKRLADRLRENPSSREHKDVTDRVQHILRPTLKGIGERKLI